MQNNYLKLQDIISFVNTISKYPNSNDAQLGTQYCLFFLGFMAGSEQNQKYSQIYNKAQQLLRSISTEIQQGQALEQLEILIEQYINGQRNINQDISDDPIRTTTSNQQKDVKKAIIREIQVNELDNKVQQNQQPAQSNYFTGFINNQPQPKKKKYETLEAYKQDFQSPQKDNNKQTIPQVYQREKKEINVQYEQNKNQRYQQNVPFNDKFNYGNWYSQGQQEVQFQNQANNQQKQQNRQNNILQQPQNQIDALFDFEENKKRSSSFQQILIQKPVENFQSPPITKKRIKITEITQIKEEELTEIAIQESSKIKDQLHLQFQDQQKQKSIILKNQQLNQQTNECNICLEKLESSEFVTLSCQDAYHNNCLQEFAENQQQFPILCPNQNCKKEILLDDLRIFCNQKLLEQLENASFNIFLQQNPQIFQCPTPDCNGLYEIEGPNQLCLICKNVFCTKCRRLQHEGVCGEASFIKFANKEKYRECAKCQRWVEKISGCEHIKCTCGFQFCYVCAEKWTHGHICQPEKRNTGLFHQIIQSEQRRLPFNHNQHQEQQNARLRNYGLLQVVRNAQ